MNPSGAVPVLEVTRPDGTKFVLAQSLAILEYLEEAYPDHRPLLPKELSARAFVRQMVGVLLCDAYPPSNARVAGKVGAIRKSEEDEYAFVREINLEAFTGYEGLLERHGGKFSFGDEVTLADVCLVPQVDLAQQYDFALEVRPLERLRAVVERLMEMPEFKFSGWRHQVGTPDRFRVE